MTVHAPKHAFTVEEYHRMAEAGVFTEDDRVELIEGEVLEMAAIGRRHAGCVNRLTRLFTKGVGDRAVVSVQNPIQVGELSEPEPDLTLARPRDDFYSAGHPAPEDILLLVEVTDTSHRYDEVKIAVYARHGIPEVWQVDVEDEAVTVYREPSLEGYRSARTIRRSDSLSPAALPELRIPAAAILG